MAMERVVLQAIKFDFNVTHPYKYIIEVSLQFSVLNNIKLVRRTIAE